MGGPEHIAIGGLIGAGKTEAAKAIGLRLKKDVLLEPVKENRYLGLFYADKPTWAMRMQVMLISARFRLVREHMQAHPGQRPDFILDRTIYEDTIFEQILHDEGSITDLDHETYVEYVRWVLLDQAPLPDAIIYLDVTPERALERIHLRGRPCEQSIPLEYLQRLARGYDDLFVDLRRRTAVATIDWNENIPPSTARYRDQIEHVVWAVKQAHTVFHGVNGHAPQVHSINTPLVSASAGG